MGREMNGGCYCRALRYRVSAAPVLKAQCHCRACQHVSGGGPNYFMLIPPEGFSYVEGKAKRYSRPDLPKPVVREFCAVCGTHVLTRRPDLPQIVLKVGTLDDPGVFGGPKIAIFCEEKAAFHIIPDGVRTFDSLPEQVQ